MSETVVIVDDSLTVRMDLAEAFEVGGFHVVPCATAAEARAALARDGVDVVVLDVVLPDGDGIELLAEIRRNPAHARLAVLMLSSEAEVKDRIRALQIGADEYVGKPYDRNYVVAKSRELVRSRSVPSLQAQVVLVIDDSVTFREALRGQLEKAGYTVLVAESGEEGLRMAADHRPSAIVVDGMLPGIDGATVIRHVRLDTALRSTPCLLLTASEDRRAELRALDAGADAFVRKEDQSDVILARLAATLRNASKPSDAISLLGPRKILAVDDSPTYLHQVAATLHGEGYDVALARSGEEALELLAVQPVDCILLDMVMPGLGGKETCRRIKAAPGVRDIPLIMLTGLEDRTAMLEGLGAGADDYIQKSGELEVLKARVRAQIRRKQFEDENRRIREQLLHSELDATEARAARQLAEARAQLTVELQAKNRELEAFSYTVSHDLRAPLRSISGFAQAVVDDYSDALDETGRDFLRRITTAAQRMSALVDDLLKLSQVGRGELRLQRVDLALIAEEVFHALRELDPERVVDVRIGSGLHADGDAGLLRTLLENLIGNAWKFTSQREHPVIELGVEPDGKTFYVRDNGVGFDAEQAAAVFQPFERLPAHQQFEGSGIGLATAQRIIERHEGQIRAEGRIGVGATFWFRLP